ncbi:MAG: caspase family protein [Candidatus Sigynarchaeum springense]
MAYTRIGVITSTPSEKNITGSGWNIECPSQSLKKTEPGFIDRFTVPLSIPVKDAGSPANVAEGYAVIAGVSDYPGTSNDLQYSDDDAIDVNSLVLNTFHVPSSNVVCLTNSQATTSALTSAVSNFASKMDADDTLFFYFSGHGSSAEQINTYSWSVQSTHPYSNNMNSFWHYSVPGVQMMRVHFVEVYTEYGYDYVDIGDYADTSNAAVWDYFTGGPYYDVWSSWVYTDDIYVNLETDYSYTYWGFQVDQVQTMRWVAPYEFIPYDGLTDGFTGPELDALLDTVPGKVITVFDTCNSGGVGSAIQATGRYSMTACQDIEMSLEDSSAYNGVFTRYFLLPWTATYDADGDGAVSFEETFSYISTNTISRSTALGFPHHPQQYDNIAGSTIFQPNAKINSITVDGSYNTNVNFYLNGLGWGELSCIYYDKNSQTCIIQYNNNSILPSASPISKIIAAPTGGFTTSAVTSILSAKYGNYIEKVSSSVEVSGPAFNSLIDSDGDGINDLAEFNLGINMWAKDSEGDGMMDGFEIQHGLNPSFNDASFDPDNDAIPNIGEYINGLNPNIANNFTDKDSDGLFDKIEYLISSNISNPDTDGDGMWDDWEYFYSPIVDMFVPDAGLDPDGDGLTNINEYGHRSDPGSVDSDSDGMPDAWEHAYGLFLTLNDGAGDLDHDGLTNYLEYIIGGNPANVDTDGDRLDDYFEYVLGTRINATESDGDGFSDYDEYSLGSDPCNPGDTPLLHVFGFCMVAAVVIVAIIGARQRGKNHEYPRPRPSGPRPSDLYRHTQIVRPRIQMTPYQRPYTSSPSYYTSPYRSPPLRTYPQPTIILPYEIQRQLEALPPEQRALVKAILIQKIQERIAEERRASVQSPVPRFCKKCGQALIEGRCATCGYSPPLASDRMDHEPPASFQRPVRKFCTKCGHALIEGRCTNCGYSPPPL